MAVISLARREEDIWLASRWIFNRFLNDVMTACGDRRDMLRHFEQAKALDGLHFHILFANEQLVADAMLQVVRKTAFKTVEEKDTNELVGMDGLDTAHRMMYLKSVRELLQLIDSWCGRQLPPKH